MRAGALADHGDLAVGRQADAGDLAADLDRAHRRGWRWRRSRLIDLPVELVTKAREPSRLTATSNGPLPTLSVRVVVLRAEVDDRERPRAGRHVGDGAVGGDRDRAGIGGGRDLRGDRAGGEIDDRHLAGAASAGHVGERALGVERDVAAAGRDLDLLRDVPGDQVEHAQLAVVGDDVGLEAVGAERDAGCAAADDLARRHLLLVEVDDRDAGAAGGDHRQPGRGRPGRNEQCRRSGTEDRSCPQSPLETHDSKVAEQC